MAETIQSTEGLATVQYKIILDQKRVLIFDPNVVTFMEAELNDDVYGTGTGLHVFRTLDPNFLESLKQAMANANPVLEFRLGFGVPQAEFWLPWQRHLIVTDSAKFEGIGTAAGHLIIIESRNELVRMERSNKVLARKGTISEIVAAIAAENSLDAVIEPTQGQFLLYQSFQDDTHFIQTRCLPRAITGKGRAGFFFFVKDNALHFHTPDYQASVLKMNYYDVFGTDLMVNDLSQNPSLWDSGVAGIRLITVNPYTGEATETVSKPENALKLADSIYQFENVYNGQANAPYHLGANPPVEAIAIAQHGYQLARQRVFKCSVTVDKTIRIRHGDLLNLSATQQESRASSHSGYYYVVGAAHMVKKQAVSTVYTLMRGEVRGQQQSFSAQNAQNQLIPEAQAPGQEPNIMEVQSSELTKGSGNKTSAKTYAVVADAKTGQPLV